VASRLRTGAAAWQDATVEPQKFTTTLADNGRAGAFVAVPFDPDEVWAAKRRHHVRGTVNGCGVRGVIETGDAQPGFTVGAAWLRDFRGGAIGDTVTVVIAPEGPQRNDLDDDVAAALDANPEAGAFFDSLAQFYRKAYLKWVDGAKRRPEVRAERIAELVQLLTAGVKQRPKP
jgi:hypothetical protein